MTTQVQQLGYIAIGVKNLEEATDYYSRIVRLEQTERIGKTAFMTGGTAHHWLRLEETGEEGLTRVGYEVDSEADLLAMRSALQKAGIPFTEGGDPTKDRVQRWLRFVDPAGMNVELYCEMWTRGTAPFGTGVKIEKFLHAGWESPNWDASVAFYRDILGFKISDFIGDRVAFFRAKDRFHHSLVQIRSDRLRFHHFCIQVESIDDVMRFRNNALQNGVELHDDVLRHAPSGSIGVYMKDKARGFAVEYCTGHPQLAEDHRPRILPVAIETVDVWKAPLPAPPGREQPRAALELCEPVQKTG